MQKDTKTIRELNDMEAAFTYSNARLPLCVVCVLELEAVPASLDWAGVLHRLQQRHPLLQSRISEGRGAYFFEAIAPCPPIPFRQLDRKNADSWRPAATNAVNTIFKHDGPLMKCWHISNSNDQISELIICFHHAIIDGASARLILHEILSLAGGQSLPPSLPTGAPPRFPTPYRRGNGRWKKILAFMGHQFREEWRYRFSGLANPIPKHSRNELISLQLDRKVSRKLKVRVGRAGLTLNSILLAAITAVVIRHRYTKGSGRQARVLSFADLRSSLQPQVHQDEMGCHISMLRLTIPLQEPPDTWQLAREIRKAMFQASRRGEVFMMSIMSKQLVKLAFTLKNTRLGVGAISFIGKLDLEPEYSSLKLRQVRAFITNNQYGPELSAFGKILFGKISLDFTYLQAETDRSQAVRMVEEIKQLLEKLAE